MSLTLVASRVLLRIDGKFSTYPLINPFFIFCKCSFPSFFSKGSSLSFPPGSIRDYLNSILTLVKEVDFRLASWESFFGYSEIGPERIVKILLI